jgi:iron(III) transport system substrate-binding protein
LADAAEIAAAQTSLAKLLEGAKGERELNLLGGGGTWGSIEAARALERAFNRHYGLSARITFSPGPAMPEMAVRIAREFKAGQKSATDLYIGSESHFVGLSREKALNVYPWRRLFSHIPEEMIELDGQIVREASRFIGITYNSKVVSERELPRRLDDLLKPMWKGKIASTPYAASFDRLAQVMGVERTRGFLKKFSPHVAGLIRCGEEERVASGEFILLALNCGNYVADRARGQGLPVGAAVLEDAPMVGYWYLGVPKNSHHPNLAALLIGFLLAKEGQKLRHEAVGATAHLIEGTPANKEYKELAAGGIQIRDFTAQYVIQHGKMLDQLRDEFQKILQNR